LATSSLPSLGNPSNSLDAGFGCFNALLNGTACQCLRTFQEFTDGMIDCLSGGDSIHFEVS
jgi:hypothetical protein